ncbi:phosphoenolpyruvate carboxykinase (ATP) [Pelobacter propionicus]|uniref:Phosphoenolpyruvate carboxykinase (ATP) n=1 Tax=Pelobacter propionicus (strain DSM 2379 / NBRC 103807 / OttBd1) TaxID=338966 RepID=PCKA_PELPD|nr:phosphoenolpyruvate carboxykinase (ATP) [Pelobacter propionicus]A1AV24.1 RecName: Full=Phosphoenolpyruvate carboxykinase (ATP); Short=PCK; Short=PEP carboxykinase; Short=PEPCK [Pelobacter propionicus DSM 2379]ABL01195.1 Phosphoenolpyruvate carboxykinase (ATP) [Pelobacter propionicus DSM 2379]
MKFNDVTRGTGLEEHGITNANLIYWTPPTSVLYEQIIKRGEGLVSHMGALAVKTGHYTGRAANEKFIVDEPTCHENVAWGKVNKPFDPQKFDELYKRMLAYMDGRNLFVQDCFAGADREHRLPLRIITERAWHSLFARNMFIRATPEELEQHEPRFALINLPGFHAIPSIDGTHSEAFIIVNLGRKLILIGGTSYAGEIKKSIFTILNYILPVEKKILSMHCSANVGPKGDSAVFFGLSGTGKTTLSADSSRALIGDDEHGWDDKGLFNFEGGCYAKIIRLCPESEPEIFATTRRFGTILENVAINTRTRRVDLDDDSFTENTRASYPLTHIPNIVPSGIAGHPANIIMLTCDAYGVLPPISHLTKEQAMYHFLSGYTARVAGTEAGVKEPTATFSTCFGGPFMALNPTVYGELLREKISRHNVSCWLVNTGWNGGPYGVGERIRISYSRALINAALDGTLADGSFETDPFFGLAIPTSCPGVPSEMLNPRNTWSDPARYDDTASRLVAMFRSNFTKYQPYVSAEVANAL